MAIELITGHANTNHISSADGRSQNKAIFGTGNYRVYGGDGQCSVVGVTSGYKLNVQAGDILWQGMYIRVTSSESITCSGATSFTGWKLYLHYTKNNSTQIESVEFVASQSDIANTTIGDFTTEAYVKFYDYDASPRELFPLTKGAVDLVADEASARQTADETLTTALGNVYSKSDLSDMFANRANATNKRVLLKSGTLTAATSATDTTTSTLTLDEAITKFAFCEVRVGLSESSAKTKLFVPTEMITGDSESSAGGNGTYKKILESTCSVSSGNLQTTDQYFGMYINGVSAVVSKRIRLINGSFNAGTDMSIYIYGVGRVSS